MAFDAFKWKFTPPLTLPPTPAAAAPASTAAVAQHASDTRAGQLIARLRALIETAKYLESVIVERTKDTGVKLDYKTDPELFIAVSRTYGTEQPPDAISIEMYDSLLDGESGFTRADIAIEESGADVQVDPVQRLDLTRINGAVETALVEDGSFNTQLPLLLRPLKSDRVIFDNLVDGLNQYPVLNLFQAQQPQQSVEITPDMIQVPQSGVNEQVLTYTPAPPTSALTDSLYGSDALGVERVAQISSDLASQAVLGVVTPVEINTGADLDSDSAANLNDRLTLWEDYYNNVNVLATHTDAVYSDVGSITQSYFSRPLHEISNVLVLLSALKPLFTIPLMKQLRAGLTSFVFPRLIAEVAKFNFSIDRSVGAMTLPAMALLSSIGRLFSDLRAVGNDFVYASFKDGGSNTLVRQDYTKTYTLPKAAGPQLATVPKGVHELIKYLNWSMTEVQRERNRQEMSCVKMLDSKLHSDNDRLQAMQTISSLDALLSITSGYCSRGFQGSGAPASSSSLSQIQNNVSQFLDQSGASRLPRLPGPPPGAVAVFTAAQRRAT